MCLLLLGTSMLTRALHQTPLVHTVLTLRFRHWCRRPCRSCSPRAGHRYSRWLDKRGGRKFSSFHSAVVRILESVSDSSRPTCLSEVLHVKAIADVAPPPGDLHLVGGGVQGVHIYVARSLGLQVRGGKKSSLASDRSTSSAHPPCDAVAKVLFEV